MASYLAIYTSYLVLCTLVYLEIGSHCDYMDYILWHLLIYTAHYDSFDSIIMVKISIIAG